jgi:hypothetical protein
MKNHPGRYCRDCNPRAEDGDEEGTEGYSNEDAELSESWSDGSGSSGDGCSATYSELLDEREEVAEATKYLEDKVAVVDAVAANLQAAVDNSKSAAIPVGELQGKWTLYNLDICPKTSWPTSEYYQLWVSQSATEGNLLDRRQLPQEAFKSFIEWMIKEARGDIQPFLLPQHASLERIPILLIRYKEDDVPADITFLGDDCLRLRVPRSIIFPAESRGTAGHEPMIEFAGIRWTEADEAARKAQLESERQRRARSPGTPSMGAQLGGYAEW